MGAIIAHAHQGQPNDLLKWNWQLEYSHNLKNMSFQCKGTQKSINFYYKNKKMELLRVNSASLSKTNTQKEVLT